MLLAAVPAIFSYFVSLSAYGTTLYNTYVSLQKPVMRDSNAQLFIIYRHHNNLYVAFLCDMRIFHARWKSDSLIYTARLW